ncbi:Bug family tripartite tricarboxylate transporter substrate binding protein [Microvirga antarctica]|uniref:Bug family tripartite tricarboxylate transporter substrate binding protein n=1 Tax=Microvirga antarctica TaxID=2819233 RepID=UPI001B30D2E4|nr:tripartite tricarboxylate transporter substrate binding protein [Microvirga antarctica]
MRKSALTTFALAIAAVTMSIVPAAAQSYPTKPIRIIVPFPAGGSADIQTRAFADAFAVAMGQPVVVDNRGGASGNIGTEAAARAEPDGYTLLIGGSNVINNGHLYKTVPYDWKKDLTPLGLMFSNSNVLIVNKDVPAANVKEFVELLRASPGKYKYGTTGAGGSTHLSTVLFMDMTKTDMLHIPYKGDSQAQTDLLSGEIQTIFNGISPSIANIDAKEWKALATTGAKRSAKLNSVPTLQESGLDGYVVVSWQGLFGPAGMPDDVVAKIRAGFDAVYKNPEALKRFEQLGTEPAPSTPAEHAAFMAAQSEIWTPIFRKLNLTQQ